MFEALLAQVALANSGNDGAISLTTVTTSDGTVITAPDDVPITVYGTDGCTGTGYYYYPYTYPYYYTYPTYGYYYPSYYYYPGLAETSGSMSLAGAPDGGAGIAQLHGITGADTAPVQTQGDGSVVGAAHMAQLSQWDNSYSWYPDTPGHYPDSKWSWYYNDGGLYDKSHQLAVLPGAAGPTEAKAGKATPANPGHMLVCSHAFLLGVLEATGKLVQTGKFETWTDDFKGKAKEAAKAGSPVGGFIMQEHILKD